MCPVRTSTFTTNYIYDAFGKVIQETTIPTCNTCFPTNAPVTGTEYLIEDHLGSTRMAVNNQGQVLRRYDFLPFGEEIVAGVGGRGADYEPSTYAYPTTPDDVLKKFTGKERDSETGLDYFGARYLSGAMGRWSSPDWSAKPASIPYGDLSDPQTLNLYGYLRNKPISRTDPDGHGECEAAAGGDTAKWMTCKGVSAAITGYELVSGAVMLFKAADDVVTTAGAKAWNQLNPPNNGMLLGEIPVGPPAAGAAGFLAAVEESASSAFTRWGWKGTKKFLAAVRTLKQPGTHELVEGILPTVEEAKQLIQKAGGTVERIEDGHAVAGVNEHTYPHINYTTASGSKATVRIESTGK